MKLEKRIVMVTGGARGLGKAYAEAVLERGAMVSGFRQIDILLYVETSTAISSYR